MIKDRKNISPKLGEGMYISKDIFLILGLDHKKVARRLSEYWSGGLQADYDYILGDKQNKAINFYIGLTQVLRFGLKPF